MRNKFPGTINSKGWCHRRPFLQHISSHSRPTHTHANPSKQNRRCLFASLESKQRRTRLRREQQQHLASISRVCTEERDAIWICGWAFRTRCSRRLYALDPPVYLFAGARASTHTSARQQNACVIATTRYANTQLGHAKYRPRISQSAETPDWVREASTALYVQTANEESAVHFLPLKCFRETPRPRRNLFGWRRAVLHLGNASCVGAGIHYIALIRRLV
jgi:hypothetical protein